MPRLINLIGQRFGRLIVIRRGSNHTKNVRWICQCTCGKQVEVMAFTLKNSKSQSCGCAKSVVLENPRYTGHGPISGSFWRTIQKNAMRRGIRFEITIQEALNLFYLQNRQCALSGVDLHFSPNARSRVRWQTASLDRIDSNLGYCWGNIQWIHKDLQQMKMEWTQTEFITWCQRIADHSRKSRLSQSSESPPERATPKLRLVKKQD